MDSELLSILKTYDKPEYKKYPPPDFDYKHMLARVKELKPTIKKIVGRSLVLHDYFQYPTSFFADLSVEELHTADTGQTYIRTIVGIRFSCFGNLFTIWSSSSEPLEAKKITAIVEAVEARGFVYIDMASLDEPYYAENHRLSGTWWDQYFELLPT
ncbi:MAG: hypothetical protein BroJett011_26220 [Chloroflexota bacterium]|nr:MAG: hypothetical protein BroJett011_26220 [Chloroflexota bacterium]